MATVIKDETYYFEDNVFLLVESCLFKVPRTMLKLQSSVFSNMFRAIKSDGDLGEGSSDEKPIVLLGVSALDFRRTLKYLYPLTTAYDTFTATWGYEHWISVLRVADVYMMGQIKEKAIKSLDKLHQFPSPVDRISLGRQYYEPWIREGLKELITREETLHEDEALRLGLKDTVRCFQAREALLKRTAQLWQHKFSCG